MTLQCRRILLLRKGLACPFILLLCKKPRPLDEQQVNA
jgi:hypothetical protein